jgi:ABC-type antimicrobial peptide transport system ATPase subunit
MRDPEVQTQTTLDERQRAQRRLDALRRIGRAVDEAGLYERVLIPGHCLSNDLF